MATGSDPTLNFVLSIPPPGDAISVYSPPPPFAAWGGGGEYTLIASPGGGIDKTKFSVGSLPVAIYNTLPDFTTSSTPNALVLHVDMAPIPGTAYWRGDRSG